MSGFGPDVVSVVGPTGVYFDFEIIYFPFLDGDLLRSISYGVYISQLIRFNRVSSYLADLLRNFLNRVIGIINIAKPFLNFIDDTMI